MPQRVRTSKHLRDERLTDSNVAFIVKKAKEAVVSALGVDPTRNYAIIDTRNYALIAKAMWVTESCVRAWAKPGRNGMTLDHAKFLLTLYDTETAHELQECFDLGPNRRRG